MTRASRRWLASLSQRAPLGGIARLAATRRRLATRALRAELRAIGRAQCAR